MSRRAPDEAERWAEAMYAEILAGPEWPADVRSAPGPGDPELEEAEAEPEAGASFPEDSRAEIRYPLTRKQELGDRPAWPWLPGWVASVCGPGEREICVQAPELAMEHQGETVYPVCFRDSSELRLPEAGLEPGLEAEAGL